MKKTMLSILFLVLCLGPALAGDHHPPVPRGDLTLALACSMALEKNPGILQARQRICRAEAVLVQARSALKPGITATGHAMAIDAVIQPDWAPTVRASEAFNEYSAGIQLTWLLFNGFTRDADILASRYGVDQSRQGFQDAQRLLIKAVSTTYYQAQIAIEKMIIARQNQAFNQALEKDAKIRFQVGQAPEADVLNFSLRVLQAETDYLAAQQAFDVTCTALARLMAVDGTRLPDELLPQKSASTITNTLSSFETEMAFARKNRPDLKALDKNILALDQRYRAARGNYYPRVYLVSGLDYLLQDDKAAVDEEEHTGYLGINFQWDLYTGGRRTGKVKEMYADLLNVRQKRRQTLLAMEAEIQTALLKANTAWKTWQQLKKTVELTQTIRGHIEKAYKVGRSTLTRLNQAQTDYVNAAGAEAASRIQYRISLVNLDAAAGRTPVFPDTKNRVPTTRTPTDP